MRNQPHNMVAQNKQTTNSHSSVDVLLTYGWVRSTYAALRNFASHGLRVAVADSRGIGMCQWSRYRAHFYRYESPSRDETEIIARHRDAFPSTVAIPISSASQLALANDKYRAQVFADQAGVPAPRMLDYKDLKHLSALLAESGSGHRWVVKLRKSNSAKGVFYPSNTASVVAVVEQVIKQFNLPNDRLPLVQEYVEGEGWGVSCLYWEGQRIASFTHRRLREKTRTGGTSTLREHQPNPLVEEMAHKLLGALGWHGLAMVE